MLLKDMQLLIINQEVPLYILKMHNCPHLFINIGYMLRV